MSKQQTASAELILDPVVNHLSFLDNTKIQHNFLKRAFDIIFSSSILITFFPLLFILSLIVRFTSKGHVFFGHERIGRGGKPFKCYKFRTMYKDADIRLKELLKDPIYKKEWDLTHKLKNDPRITPIGKFLRQTSLDEFPQFWNVLKGDLSIVGPRPVTSYEIEKHYGKNASTVLSCRPGLTCLWQVERSDTTSYKERVALDLNYIENRTFALDLKLIAKTIPTMLLRKGC